MVVGHVAPEALRRRHHRAGRGRRLDHHRRAPAADPAQRRRRRARAAPRGVDGARRRATRAACSRSTRGSSRRRAAARSPTAASRRPRPSPTRRADERVRASWRSRLDRRRPRPAPPAAADVRLRGEPHLHSLLPRRRESCRTSPADVDEGPRAAGSTRGRAPRCRFRLLRGVDRADASSPVRQHRHELYPMRSSGRRDDAVALTGSGWSGTTTCRAPGARSMLLIVIGVMAATSSSWRPRLTRSSTARHTRGRILDASPPVVSQTRA